MYINWDYGVKCRLGFSRILTGKQYTSNALDHLLITLILGVPVINSDNPTCLEMVGDQLISSKEPSVRCVSSLEILTHD